MMYVVHWFVAPQTRDENNDRFKKKGHNEVAGVKILNAVYALHEGDGWAIVEAEDPVALGKWVHNWSDLNEQEVIPVVDEKGRLAIMGA